MYASRPALNTKSARCLRQSQRNDAGASVLSIMVHAPASTILETGATPEISTKITQASIRSRL